MCFAPQRRALLMSHLASWLRTRRFSEPTFRPSGATNHWKNTVNRDFPIFSRICIFFLLILSLLTRLTSAFQLSILSEVSLLNFLRPYICPTFPYIFQYYHIYFPICSIYFFKYYHIYFPIWPYFTMTITMMQRTFCAFCAGLQYQSPRLGGCFVGRPEVRRGSNGSM